MIFVFVFFVVFVVVVVVVVQEVDPNFLGLKSAAWLHPWVNTFQVVEQKTKKTKERKKERKIKLLTFFQASNGETGVPFEPRTNKIFVFKQIVKVGNDKKDNFHLFKRHQHLLT